MIPFKNYKKIFVLLFVIITSFVRANNDSLRIDKYSQRLEKVEIFQDNVRESLDNKFTALENKINKDNNLVVWIGFIGLGLNVFFIGGIMLKARNYIQKKISLKFDNIINENENQILQIVDKHNEEKQILITKKILVLSSKQSDDTFIRKFFRTMGFSNDNVNYEKISSYNKYKKKYDLIFINNEDGTLDNSIICQYFQKSADNDNKVLFFFGRTYQPTGDEVKRLSFANSRTQIFGNLINLLRYQDVLR